VLTDRKKDILELLQKYWGHASFRPLQENIILSVLSKHDTLALLPTGGGKSICFQVPGLVLGGTTLVISPLIALMNDQVQNLRRRGISAVAISSAMSFREIDVALNNAALGHVQFLYVSPERLQNDNFRQKLSHLPITLLAVDEAHCISQWGYDFRPSYLKIAELRAFFPGTPVIALTASATRAVAEDIQLKLDFKQPKVFRQSFERSNLRYVVQLEENKYERLLRLIANIGGSGLVYVRNRKVTEETAKFLKKNGITSLAYHAGLKYEDRKNIQQQWIDNKVQVICATNAFGMGIDKPDVRFVVHLDLPESLEAYFQEAGRAGRDGKTAYATIFYTKADQERLHENFRQAFPELEYVKQSYQAICNYYQVAVGAGQGLSVDFEIDRICASYNLKAVLVFNSVKFLEKENYLSFVDAGYEPSKVMMLAGKEDLYEFELRFPKFEPLIKTMLRSYGGLFENYVFISEKDLAFRVKLSVAALTEQLRFLDKEQLLSFIPQSVIPKLIFTRDRVQSRFMEFDPANYHKLKERQLQRINSVIEYTDNIKICRQVQLLSYFDELDFKECGYCDVCIASKPVDEEKLKGRITALLGNKPLSLEELKAGMKRGSPQAWLKVFNKMVDDGWIAQEGLLYRLRKGKG
jgi:ATP-dependent DNA helicase RecQ